MVTKTLNIQPMKKLISWVEIPAVDFKRAVNFYTSLLEVELNLFDFGEEKMACFPNDEGAISFAPDFQPSLNGTLVSFNMEERLDKVLGDVKDMGGKVVRGKTKIESEGRGYFALIVDTEGNKIGLYGDK
jgi:predicted enzyme related to lactoylglutathione lyase